MSYTWEVVFGYTNADYNYAEGPFGALDEDVRATVLGDYLYLIKNDSVYRMNAAGTWTTQTASAAYGYRYGFEVVVFNNKMWLLGGYTGAAYKNDVWSSTDGATWTQETANAGWAARCYFGACVWNEKMWVAGGKTGGSTAVNDLWVSLNGTTWTQVDASCDWSTRCAHVLAPVGGGLVVLGGVSGDWSTMRTDGWLSADSGVTWTSITPAFTGSPEAFVTDSVPWTTEAVTNWDSRISAKYVYSNGHLWYTGGSSQDIDSVYSWPRGIWHTTDGMNWDYEAELPTAVPDETGWWNRPTPRYGGALAYFNSRLYDFSGVGYEYFNLYGVASVGMVWRTTEDVDDPDIETYPHDNEWWGFACTPYGSAIDRSTAVDHDFMRILVFDLNHGAVFPGWGFPIVCTMANSSPCAGSAQTPTGIFGGTVGGYIAKIMGSDAAGIGTPCRRVAWTLDSGCTTSVLKVALTEGEDFLPTYWVSDGPPEVRAGFLVGLSVIVVHADGTEAAGVISANTNDTVTLSSALTTAPAAGDVLLISPMVCALWFQEQRFQFPASPVAIYPTGYNNQGRDQPMTVDIFSGSGPKHAVDVSAATVSKSFLFEDAEKGDGRISLPGLASKALMYGLWFRPVGGGYFQLDGLQTLERIR